MLGGCAASVTYIRMLILYGTSRTKGVAKDVSLLLMMEAHGRLDV
jgi:hypothetical protein